MISTSVYFDNRKLPVLAAEVELIDKPSDISLPHKHPKSLEDILNVGHHVIKDSLQSKHLMVSLCITILYK